MKRGDRATPSRWAAELALGLRLALSGGRSARARATLTAVGVGLGVALLLGAASIPTMVERTQQRSNARSTAVGTDGLPAGAATLLVDVSSTTYRGAEISGRDLQAEGPRAPAPPGTSAVPAPGTMVVSPDLRDLLASERGALLRERLDARVVGVIGEEGLAGPRELTFYRGTDGLTAASALGRIDRFGSGQDSEPLGPLLVLLVAIAVVVLLLPVGVFVAAAVRFGGEDRDRRLAALRLVGADRATTARIAAGETLLGALGGIAIGALLFVAVRPLVERLSLGGISSFSADVLPSPALGALVLVAVPVAAVVVTLLALRSVVAEPLGVVRRAAVTRRRLWWRVLPALAALALLLPLRDGLDVVGSGEAYRAAIGVLFGLLAVTAVLPWVVEVAVRRLGGGPLSWQLATRRLQADGGTATRVVSGIAVAVAGAIALQALFGAAERDQTSPTGVAPERRDLVATTVYGGGSPPPARQVVAALEQASQADGAFAVTQAEATNAARPDEYLRVVVADCPALRAYAGVRACRPGDVFVPPAYDDQPLARPGDTVVLGVDGGERERWRVPAAARSIPAPPAGALAGEATILATPFALAEGRLPRRAVEAFTRAPDPEALERLRNAAAALDPYATVIELQGATQTRTFANLRRGILAATVAVLALIGASLLVGALEQLRERRRVLAVLVAFGTRRSTLIASVLWQVALPVALGLVVAIAAGLGLAALLLAIASQPTAFDWAGVAAMAGAGAAVAGVVTLLTLPALLRLTRPDGLRTE